MAHPSTMQPVEPDFWQCNEYYGTQLNEDDCYNAASHLPRSNVQTNTYTLGGNGEYGIPWSHAVGTCEVKIELAGPNPAMNVVLPTNTIRVYVNFVISRCVSRSNGIGGYGTFGLVNTINYINQEYESHLQLGQTWPRSSSFITFSIRGLGKPDQPGDYEPAIALKLYQHSKQAASDGSGNIAGPGENRWYAAYMTMFHTIIYGGQRETWWNPMLSTHFMPNEMEYTCNADLGSPSEADCNQLEASQLGPPSDRVIIGPRDPTVLTARSCSVHVVSSKLVSITWGQIAVALGALLQLCITFGSWKVGGVANYHPPQALPEASSFDLVGRGATGGTQVSGLNALPPSVNLTLSRTGQHDL